MSCKTSTPVRPPVPVQGQMMRVNLNLHPDLDWTSEDLMTSSRSYREEVRAGLRAPSSWLKAGKDIRHGDCALILKIIPGFPVYPDLEWSAKVLIRDQIFTVASKWLMTLEDFKETGFDDKQSL